MKEKANLNEINSTVAFKDGGTETVFGIELENLELPPRADSKIEWSTKDYKLTTRFLFAYYNKAKNETRVYESAFRQAFVYFGKPEELIKYKEIKQIYDALIPGNTYVVGANLKRKSDELEVQYLKYPDEIVVKPGDTVELPLNNGLNCIKDYFELLSSIEICDVTLVGDKKDSQTASCDNWINTDNNEIITNIYGLIYSEATE